MAKARDALGQVLNDGDLVYNMGSEDPVGLAIVLDSSWGIPRLLAFGERGVEQFAAWEDQVVLVRGYRDFSEEYAMEAEALGAAYADVKGTYDG